MVKHTQTTPQNGQTHSNNSSATPQNGQTHSKNCLSVFDRFVGLVLKGLTLKVLTLKGLKP